MTIVISGISRFTAQITFALAVCFALLPCGCAKVPSGGATVQGPQLIVSMTVAGKINPNYTYFVLFNVTNNASQSQGPIPVLAPPWGNGFASGQFTSYLRYDQTQPNAGYGMYAIVPGSNLLQSSPLPAPVQYQVVATEPNQNTLQFQIPVSALATSTIPAVQITTIQVNFLTTNQIFTVPDDQRTKLFDALGDARTVGQINSPITISTTQARTFTNSQTVPQEPQGDVMLTGSGVFRNQPDPDLDIKDWTIQVQS